MELAFLDGYSGLLNAPTGSGKTFAMFLPFIAAYIDAHPDDYLSRKDNGLQLLWITPLRALTNDIRKAMQSVVEDLGLPWKVASRTGDTSTKAKQELKKRQPEVLLTTPESLHLMLAQKEYPKMFTGLQALVVDEWHELLGTKRGVQLELGLSRLKYLKRDSALKVWGISATIANLEEAAEVLLGNDIPPERISIIRAKLDKKIMIESVIPENLEEFS